MKQYKVLKPFEIEILITSELLDIYVCLNKNTLYAYNIYIFENKYRSIEQEILDNTILTFNSGEFNFHKIIKDINYYNLLISKDSIIIQMAIEMLLNDNKNIVDKYLKQFT